MILHSAFSSKSQPLPQRNEINIKKVNFQTAAMVQHSKPNPLLGCWVEGDREVSGWSSSQTYLTCHSLALPGMWQHATPPVHPPFVLAPLPSYARKNSYKIHCNQKLQGLSMKIGVSPGPLELCFLIFIPSAILLRQGPDRLFLNKDFVCKY